MLWDVNIQKTYRSRDNHFEIDICFQSNSKRLVLFGPSGAGKTQVLKMLSGLVTPDNGHIQFSNNDLFNSHKRILLTPQQRHLAYVFQNYALFPHLTVVQNMAFSLHKHWLNPPKHTESDQVDYWLNKLELKPLAHQYPHQLSGGQGQRVALARALIMSPQAVLLDEPFSALDEKLRHNLRQELVDLQAQLSLPMILISHHPDDVKIFGEEIICLSHGKIATNPA
jgi:molybdate transport system ATP-binding protein